MWVLVGEGLVISSAVAFHRWLRGASGGIETDESGVPADAEVIND